MSLSRLVCATCLTLALAGPALTPAWGMDTPQPPQAGNFTLQEPAARLKLRLIPGNTLAAGYRSPFYQQNTATGAITLQTDGLQPSIQGQTAPATVLREGTAWYFQQTPADMSASLHIDTWPSDQRVIIGRIQSPHGPVAELVADGHHSQVTAIIHDGTSTRRIIAGTIYPDRHISYTISSRPSGTLQIVVNGTRNMLPMPVAATAPVMWFEAVAGQTGWHMPCHGDMARVTFTSLDVRHPAP
ncbi:polysaccharide lyase family 7 protein [Gluconobacter roseus]|uniref:polysaccharide lyase family 7 protein n=1 Tax=Gluconobacter roseus TaxID=586239 RepID=UPI0038CF5F0C